jgi:hypothetical protein
MKHTKQFGIVMGLIAGLATIATNNASAQTFIPITGWGLETGAANATLTDNGGGNFSVTTPTGNAAPRAVLPVAADFSVVGEEVDLQGTVTIAGLFGNEQFRFGLFNTNNNNPGTLGGGLWSGAVASGWLGYIVEPGNGQGGGTTRIAGRSGSGANGWYSTTGAEYDLEFDTTSGTAVANGTYSFDLTLTRLSATSVGLTYSFIETDGTGNFVAESPSMIIDNGGLSSGMTSFDAAGFFLNANTGGATFSNVELSVPEPSTFVLAGFGFAGLAMIRARRRQA